MRSSLFLFIMFCLLAIPASLLMLGQSNPVPNPSPLPGGLQLGQARLTPTTLHFGKVTVGEKSKVNTLTMFNPGRTGLTIIGITIRPDIGDFAQVNTCGSSLAAGATCYVNVTFTPTAKGARTANLSIDSVPTAPQTVELKGTGK